MKTLVAGLAAALILISPLRSHALQFERLAIGDGSVVVVLRGSIIQGDAERLVTFVGGMAKSDRIVALFLDSPGGNVVEAERLANGIAAAKLSVAVAGDSKCASACFLLFAASPRKYAGINALIGVHSASEDGQETLASMGMTTAMARDAAAYGIPSSIIGKMVQATPGRMEWLTPFDFKQMGVTIIPASAPAALASTAASRSVSAPTASVSEPSQASPMIQQGQADRRDWETWFTSLSGDFRDGALYWTGERSKPRPGSCYGPAGQAIGDWTTGCNAAKARLRLSDLRRKTEPDYRTGWNSP